MFISRDRALFIFINTDGCLGPPGSGNGADPVALLNCAVEAIKKIVSLKR